MEALIQDLKQAFRTFRDHPGFTATALVALLLGIGVNTAIFSVLSAVLFKPLPFPDPDRLVLIMQSFRGTPTQVWSAPAEVAHWQNQSDVLEDVAAWKTVMLDYAAGDAPLSVRTGTVTEGYFRALRTRFVAGRGFAPEEDLPGAAKTVVLSHAFWTRRLGADPEIVGKAIPLNGEPHTVIGITTADFDVHDLDIRGAGEPEVWVPLQLGANTIDTVPRLDAFARLEDGVTHEVARQRLAASVTAYRERFPDDSLAEWGFTTLPLREAIVRDARPMLFVLVGAVALVLLISCANVASLLLVRATRRYREVAIRSALGAGRWRIVRQLLTESAVLSLAGGAIGLLAGVLNGAAFGRDVVDPSAPGNTATNTGQFVIAVDVSRFIAPDVFAAEMDRHLKDLASSPTLPGFESIRLPGADRRKRRADRSVNGVQLSAPLRKQLDDLAARLKLQPLGERS